MGSRSIHRDIAPLKRVPVVNSDPNDRPMVFFKDKVCSTLSGFELAAPGAWNGHSNLPLCCYPDVMKCTASRYVG